MGSAKIRDIGWHRLRAYVAAPVDELRICCREGWLGKPRRNHLGTERKFKDRAASISGKLARMRARMGIMGAYGEKAEQLGLGKRTPPSRRDRGKHQPRSRLPQAQETDRPHRMTPGRLPASLRQFSPITRSRRLKTTVRRPPLNAARRLSLHIWKLKRLTVEVETPGIEPGSAIA